MMSMTRTFVGVVAVVLASVALMATDDGWTIPATARQEVNPVPASADVLQKGKKIYEARCQRCHGRDGTGRGPDADPEHPAGNLTDRLRGAFNTDGVMYYRIWNGRISPKMPAFKNEGMTGEEVWTVIHFAKSFRK
jgi:mono/diheme cytochrome c family protein